MGRWSRLLAPRFAEFAFVQRGQRVLDVGCGPGALTAELARRLGADAVGAVDPSAGFVRACAERVPEADVRAASAEDLPWPDGSFDAALSQLAVNFLPDADAAMGEMRRVVRPGGLLAATTWDYGSDMEMLRTFWDAALTLDPDAPDEARVMRHWGPASLHELWLRSGLGDVDVAPIVIHSEYTDFDEYWQPFLTGAGPGGAYCVSLGEKDQAALRAECFRRLGSPKRRFTLAARAWAIRGTATRRTRVDSAHQDPVQRTFETKVLPVDPDAVAPDGSEVRVLLQLRGGGLAHFELAAGQTSVAVRHRTVEEIWYFLHGRGEMWRRCDGKEDVVAVAGGVCITIPLGTEFQFRAAGEEPLVAIGTTIPPWPGAGEATIVSGPWEPTVRPGPT